jgi:raffinose/stachyose/melibiose transport system substrate-binding protein
MKKVISLLLIVGMLISLMGCGKSAATETPASKDNSTTEIKPSDLSMWCIAVESDSNRHAYVTAIEEFQKKYPDIKFTWEAIQNQDYKTKIKAAVAANEMPDIFFTWGAGFLKEFVDADRVYCLEDFYPKYASQLSEAMTENHRFDGKLYAAPTNFNVVAMFCNKDLLKQAGYDKVPSTYDELIACCDALVSKGIIPFGCSGKEAWCITEYLEPMIEKSVGAATLEDMYTGKASWVNDGVINAVAKLQDMVKKNYFDPEGIALMNDDVKANFIAGKYAFYINGTWNCSDIVNAGIDDKIAVAEFPVIDTAKSQKGELIGGPNDALAVAASSKNPAFAAEAAFELARDVCHYAYLDVSGLPAWTPDYDTSSLNELSKSVNDIVSNSKARVMFGDTFLTADKANTYLEYVNQVYNLAIDGKTFAENLDKDLK